MIQFTPRRPAASLLVRLGNGGGAARVLARVLCVFAAALATDARAQCPLEWLPGEAGRLVSGDAHALVRYDPDGAGPRPSLLIAGGSLSVAGLRPFSKALAFDGQSWASIDPGTGGTSGSVMALAVFNGELIAAGSFTDMGGVDVSNIARWNGERWEALGTGLGGGEVKALAVLGSNLYAGGTFTTANGAPAARIARWNGFGWSPMGSGITGPAPVVNALLAFNGGLYVGGSFTAANGTAANNLASSDGNTAFFPFGNPNGPVNTLAQFSGFSISSLRLYAGGAFTSVGGVAVQEIASYRPFASAWSALGSIPFSASCRHLYARNLGGPNPSVELTAISSFGFGPLGSGINAFRWDGTNWNSLGSSAGRFLTFDAGRYTLAGAGFPAVSTLVNGQWGGFGRGLNSPPEALDSIGGDVIAAGVLPSGGSGLAAVLRRAEATGLWTELGVADNSVHDVDSLAGGGLVVGGRFTLIGGQFAARVARWDAGAWSPLGTGVGQVAGDAVHEVEELSNGDVVAAGQFSQAGGLSAANIARWNGFAWGPMGSGIQGTVFALAALPGGHAVAGGSFETASGALVNNVTRWNGSAWTPLGPGVQGTVLAVEPFEGGFVAGGFITSAGGVAAANIARWTGAAWAPIGGLGFVVKALATLPDGGLLAGGSPLGSPGTQLIARWDGSNWLPVDGGVDGDVNALHTLPDGSIAAAGAFGTAGGRVSAYLARLTTACGCGSVDFDGDGDEGTDADIEAFFSAIGGGPCPTGTCGSIDFDGDGDEGTDQDIESFFRRLGGGPC